ncbi:V-snare-domain-containing protein [Microstroma glucosiphilum]|uniref:V-snare-domain-containing protein n=1 Tax=Pseudomicrostroma glucosiphilum TaxID=1684307 RepID=A0A316U7B9_9BASI|nr:V-snare-domain-containing protein [Pseudomicrostroma glucosiphilum]PWN21082.1 V-snare-domain-containing protein [Pseudomicrostroma glucosiphilum]
MASTSRLPPTAWEAHRKATRSLESQLDEKLTKYSTLASSIARGQEGGAIVGNGSSSAWSGRGDSAADMEEGNTNGGTSRAEHAALDHDISSLLQKLQSSIAALTALLDDPEVPPSAVQLHAVQRHREVLTDFERDFRRSKDNIRHAIDRRELVGKVRGDIDAYKVAHASDQEALLAERGRLDNSHSMIDGTLEQAYATLTDFRSQRQTLTNVANRMTTTASQIPALNGIMTMIGRRRRRDSIIMGLLIGCGTVILLLYMFR